MRAYLSVVRWTVTCWQVEPAFHPPGLNSDLMRRTVSALWITDLLSKAGTEVHISTSIGLATRSTRSSDYKAAIRCM